jgi:myo-inositol-hexaphosphate 3-phosphohydrolase
MIVAFISVLLPCLLALIHAQVETNTWKNISGISNWKDITVDASGTVLYATQYGGYLMRSSDGGVTWKIYTNQFYYGSKENWEMIRVSKLDYHEIVIGTYNTTGFFYFKDNSYFCPEWEGA